MSTELIREIQCRGFWRVRIHPTRFVERRVENILDLQRIIDQSSVILRGWDYPHIDRHQDRRFRVSDSYIEQSFSWDQYLEFWRVYQSGQFIHFAGIPYDWLERTQIRAHNDSGWESGKYLGVADVIYQFTEIYEFAARLALTDAGGESMIIDVFLGNLEGRQLKMDSPRRIGFVRERTYTDQSGFSFTTNAISRELLIGQARDLALVPALELFRRFRWDTTLNNLGDIQTELIGN